MLTCFYCGKEAAQTGSSLKQMMFQVISRTGTSQVSTQRPVPVPRCPNCARYHTSVRTQGNLITLGYILLFFIIMTLAFLKDDPQAQEKAFGNMGLFFLFGPFLAWGLHRVILLFREGETPRKPLKAFKDYPPIKKLMGESFQTKPGYPPGVAAPDPVASVHVETAAAEGFPIIQVRTVSRMGSQSLSDYFLFDPEDPSSRQKALDAAASAAKSSLRFSAGPKEIIYSPDLVAGKN